ncbi:hypothetical protein GH714_027356 [Hevea brasiliensis]|uniref:Cytochrome b561 domain-containing protein n=1 Tax=Hevea brasiliensis TaxID=3981 RepID=A0A6A6N6C0_HEVBR|nr:hypothetical protein GH714_027356 [Hevea brasiliensis]
MTFGNQRYVGLELGRGAGVGKRHVVAIQVDSTRSPKFLVTWALLYVAAGEVARRRMNEEALFKTKEVGYTYSNEKWIYGFLVFFFPGGSTAVMTSPALACVLGAFAYILAVANAAIGLLEKLTFLENSD